MKTLHSNDLVMLGIWNLLGIYWEIWGCYDAMDFLGCNLDIWTSYGYTGGVTNNWGFWIEICLVSVCGVNLPTKKWDNPGTSLVTQ